MIYQNLESHVLYKLLNLMTLGVYGFFRKKHLYSELKKAVESSDTAQILFFLDKGAIANDFSILKIPVLTKNKTITELLLDNGGKANISLPLLNNYDGKFHTFSETHNTYPLLEIAIVNEDIEIIKLLLQHGIKSHEGLQQALNENKIKIILMLVEKGENKKIFKVLKRFFSSIENKSIEKFHDELDLSAHLKLDAALLAIAIDMSKIDTIKNIIKIHKPNDVDLFNSIKKQKSNVFCLVLDSCSDKYIDLNLIKDKDKKTLLHIIAIHGSKEQAIHLLNRPSLNKIDINAIDDDMHTPIYYALNSKNKSVYNLLKSIGADEPYMRH